MRTKNQKGFTLLELMIVAALVSILAAIAIPAYSRYVMRSNRVEAKTNLNHVAQAQEKYFSTYNRYTNNLTGAAPNGLGLVANCSGNVGSENCLYRINVALLNGNQDFQLTAVPQTRQASDKCGSLTITGAGVKAFTGDESNGKCW